MKSIRAAYKGRCTQDFKKAEKLITSKSSDHAELEALVDRLTRRAGEIAQMDAKIVISLETEEDILKDTESALLFQDNISDWQFKIKQFLKSKQETPISGLPLTEENYRKATELLKERFGKTQNLTNAYMESLSKIHAPSSDSKNLREFHDICEANIRGLETLGVMTESYGSLLIPILLKKIPEDIRRLVFRADPLADSSLDRLRVAIRQEIETREKSHISSVEDSTSVAIDGEVFVPTAGALLTNAQQKQRFRNRRSKVSRPCTYCAEIHRPEKCDKITSVEERRSILQRQQRCLNCLGLKHTKIECYSKGRCMKCKKKHHTSICEEKQENPTQSSSYQMKENRNSNSSQSPTNTIAKNTTHMGATHSLHPTNHILMQSAITEMSGAGKQ